MKSTVTTPAKKASAAGILEEIASKIRQPDTARARAYREGLKDAAGFMGLANAMPDSPEKKALQDRFSDHCHGE